MRARILNLLDNKLCTFHDLCNGDYAIIVDDSVEDYNGMLVMRNSKGIFSISDSKYFWSVPNGIICRKLTVGEEILLKIE